MTTTTRQDRSHESVINDVLARILREGSGLDAVAETMHSGRRPDILVRMQARRIILETEFAPARTVEADALSRLGMEIDGRRVENVFAVTIPDSLRSVSQHCMYERLARATLQWREWRVDGTASLMLEGTVVELANAVRFATPPKSDLDEAVEILDKGVRMAGSRLYSAPGTLGRVAKIFDTEPGDETAHMAALVIVNAMIFQERLASGSVIYQPVSRAVEDGRFSKARLLQLWDHILGIDYRPIFGMARDLVGQLSEVEAASMLEECEKAVSAVLATGVVGRHDLSGRIFNQLISERKLLAAFYTSIPASTLLAGLALSAGRWEGVDWGNPEEIADLRVVDPACGTGTLLMAAYRQMVQNHQNADPLGSNEAILHNLLVEKVILGTDVVQSAIHLTAATLAAMSPSVEFKQMPLHALKYGMDASGEAHFGSLDWLKAPKAQSFFSATEEHMRATSSEEGIIQRPVADLVISNPPYTRSGNDGGKDPSALAGVFSIPAVDTDSLSSMVDYISKLLKGTPANKIAGHGSSFTVLADRLVRPDGRIALVLPVTALYGGSWRDVREMLAECFDIEFVVSSHDPDLLSMSYDTAIAEALLVARRLRDDERPSKRGRFVNLWRGAYVETDALALVRAIDAMSAVPLLRTDGPPVGGSPLFVGGDQWGEMIDGPVGKDSWKAARWKRALVGQFAAALERGEIWSEDGGQLVGRIFVTELQQVCNVGPQDRKIRGSRGVFDSYHGYNEYAQFPAMWSLDSRIHKALSAEPNAWLIPKPDFNHAEVWSQAGNLQITRDVRYSAQPVMATITSIRCLGVSQWHALNAYDENLIVGKRSVRPTVGSVAGRDDDTELPAPVGAAPVGGGTDEGDQRSSGVTGPSSTGGDHSGREHNRGTVVDEE